MYAEIELEFISTITATLIPTNLTIFFLRKIMRAWFFLSNCSGLQFVRHKLGKYYYGSGVCRNESLSPLLRDRLNLCFIILPKPNRKCGEKFCLQIGPHRTKQNKQVLRHKKVLTDLNVSCVGPSTFNSQDEYAERELESMGNDLHNNSHYGGFQLEFVNISRVF